MAALAIFPAAGSAGLQRADLGNSLAFLQRLPRSNFNGQIFPNFPDRFFVSMLERSEVFAAQF
jgi:hypothetical protein